MRFAQRLSHFRVLFSALLAVVCLTLVFPSVARAQGAWESVGVIDGVAVWKKEVPGTNLLAFKGEVIADVTMDKLIGVFLDKNERKNWVDRYGDSREVEKPGPLSEIYWIKFNLPVGISNRDYVLRADANANAATGVFTANIHSVVHPRVPESSCCVRAEARGTYYRFEALKGVNKVKLTVEVQTDPKGLLPGWVVNMIQKSWPSKTLNSLVRRANSGAVTPRAEYAGWHSRP